MHVKSLNTGTESIYGSDLNKIPYRHKIII